MTPRQLGALFAWDDWAFARLLETAAQTTRAKLEAEAGPEGSIRDIVAHTVAAWRIWLARWEGRPAPALFGGEEQRAAFPDLASLAAAARAVEADRSAWLEARGAGELAADFRWTDSGGRSWVAPLWVSCVHAVTHATQHRSEAALLLTRLGHSPGDLDLVYRLREPAG